MGEGTIEIKEKGLCTSVWAHALQTRVVHISNQQIEIAEDKKIVFRGVLKVMIW
jgi:hypothetical protein